MMNELADRLEQGGIFRITPEEEALRTKCVRFAADMENLKIREIWGPRYTGDVWTVFHLRGGRNLMTEGPDIYTAARRAVEELEMAEVDGQFGCENCDHEYDGTCDCWQCNHSREHESMKSQIDSLAAELAALKSAPGMEEIDALVEEWTGADAGVVQKIIRIARRSIAAREEVVGLLKYLFRNQELKDSFEWAILSDESRRILEIVEGE